MRTHADSTAFARSLAIAYTALVVYASLHPFTGWRDSGIPPTAFLSGGWPRYYTVFDLAANVLAYLPLGFLWFPVVHAHLGKAWSTLLVCVPLALLSLTLETMQNYLPSRVPSNVDLACNAVGVLLGALAAQRWGRLLLSESRILRWRHKHLAPEPIGDYGLVLIAIWLLIQLSPENLLFGSGNLRQMLGLPGGLPFEADRFSRHEGLIAAMGTFSIGMVLSLVIRQAHILHVVALIAAAAGVRSFAAALLIDPRHFDHWITFSNMCGIAVGLIFVWSTLHLKAETRQTLAAMLVLAATALVNIAPDNPYLLQAAQVWRQGHFLNFNGLTRVASTLWPFLALAFLMRHPRRRKDDYPDGTEA